MGVTVEVKLGIDFKIVIWCCIRASALLFSSYEKEGIWKIFKTFNLFQLGFWVKEDEVSSGNGQWSWSVEWFLNSNPCYWLGNGVVFSQGVGTNQIRSSGKDGDCSNFGTGLDRLSSVVGFAGKVKLWNGFQFLISAGKGTSLLNFFGNHCHPLQAPPPPHRLAQKCLRLLSDKSSEVISVLGSHVLFWENYAGWKSCNHRSIYL